MANSYIMAINSRLNANILQYKINKHQTLKGKIIISIKSLIYFIYFVCVMNLCDVFFIIKERKHNMIL